ncbi:hypothetical protein SAMN03159448_06517 [Sinorhizobium sp. NFACC03]|nr:hypothetical protein SAMN03159448_06517 [Sinorhizobium sp. NFACC03]
MTASYDYHIGVDYHKSYSLLAMMWAAVAGLEITALRRRNRLEQGPVRLEVNERCAVEAIEAAHEQR